MQAAARQGISLEALVGAWLDDCDEIDPADRQTDEAILADLREALIAVREGRTVPFREALEELKKDFGIHADES